MLFDKVHKDTHGLERRDEAPRALSYNSTIDDLNLREFTVEVSNIGKVSFNKIIHHLPLSKGRKKEDITAAENY